MASTNDSSTTDTNNPFPTGDVAWILSATCIIWIMTPGWFIWGYSLTFSRTGGPFIGDLRHAFFRNLDWNSGPNNMSRKIPEFVYAIFESNFAVIASALIIGGAAERVRLLPTIIFIFIWSTLVYDIIASWCWSANGWFTILGGLDFAGGIPVHISSGAAALAFCFVVKKRKKIGRPHNFPNIVLGTVLLWFGWFGFNGASAAAANKRAILACIVTNIAASFSGLTWMFIDFFKWNNFEWNNFKWNNVKCNKRLSAISFCSGAISGLVAITPASGYVTAYSAAIIGIASGIICKLASLMKEAVVYDDFMDVFAIHGIGGFVGNFLTGIFADKDIVLLSGDHINGGAINGNPFQILIQLSGSCVAMVYSFVVTLAILFIIDRILGLELRFDGDTDEVEM
ncbi:2956_t:CDS:2, partial [Cetraspora pellucida]